MAQTGYSPILIYGSTTTGNTPAAGNLTTGTSGVELAINATDGKLFYKDNAGVVQTIATKAGAAGTFSNVTITGGSINGTTIGATTASTGAFTTLSASSTTTLSGGTANGVAYLNGSKVVTTGSALTFDGTGFSVTGSTSATLKLNGRASDNASSANFYDNTGATRYGFIYFDASTAQIASANTTPLSFLLNGSEQMRLTSTGLGIGTSSPASKLHLSVASGSVFEQITSGSNQVYLGWDSVASMGTLQSSTGLTFATGSSYTERMRLDSSGNLGLGVTPSGWATFKVMQIGNGTADTFIAVSGNQGDFGVNAYYNAGWKYQTSSVASSRYEQSSGAHYWFTAPSGTAGTAITFTQAMTLDASGQLGIGATSPSATLHVTTGNATVGLFATSRASGGYIQYSLGASGASLGYMGSAGQISTTGGTNDFSLRAENNLLFNAGGNTERARIDSSGNLLVGTTSAGGRRLWVAGSNAGYISTIENDNATPFGLQIYHPTDVNGAGNSFLVCVGNATNRVELRSNGGIGNYSANNVNLSDERLKKDFQAAPSYYDRWQQINFVTFLYKDQTDDERNLGVKAGQLESVCPELIDNSGFGKAPEGEAPYKAVYQTDFQYATAVALQEAIKKIEQLTERITALEGK